MNQQRQPPHKTVVVIGATGHFGKRISRRITSESNIRLVVTSRSLEAATQLVEELPPPRNGNTTEAAALDHNSPSFARNLAQLNPFLVIHTAGPYQGQDYRVARACLECGAHYLDLADGRAFVDGFACLDSEAKSVGLLMVSGASTLPGLSTAVVNELKGAFTKIGGIDISIAPAHQTPRGRGTIEAVLSYCGKPFQVLEGGAWVTRHGWQDLRRQHYPQLGKRLSGACDVPDLSLLPREHSGVETVTFHAALEAWWEQIGLWMMAGITRTGLIKSWSRFSGGFERISGVFQRLGSSTGGMAVRVSGEDLKQKQLVKIWYLTAHENHGPEIPCSPALVLARKLIRGGMQKRGAMPCLGLMTLDDFDEEVHELNISWEIV